MEVTASHRYADIAPRKARLVADLIRGADVSEAQETLRLTRKRASSVLAKVLAAAVAAASEQHDLDADELSVARVWVDKGPMRRKYWARPRGMFARKLHRTSHIHIVLDEKTE